LEDAGDAFGSRNGYKYGWDKANPHAVERRNISTPNWSILYDTFIRMQTDCETYQWELEVPNVRPPPSFCLSLSLSLLDPPMRCRRSAQGDYNIIFAVGDAVTYDCHNVAVEGRTVLAGCTGSEAQYLKFIGTVTVADGRLTLSNGDEAGTNNKVSEGLASRDGEFCI
jgi:hypothetical protein